MMIELNLPRFYPVLDTALSARLGISVPDAAEAILEGGAQILQLRHKGHFSRQVFSDAKRIAQLCAAAGALFVINDRADMAALLNVALHLGQDDLWPCEVRRFLPPDSTVGFSTHNEEQLRSAADQPADYLALGPIFATATKENPDPVVGLKELQRLRAITNKPLVAIGGISRDTALKVLRTGADSIAVIGDLVPEEVSNRALRARTEEWLQLLKT
jgi:thiamine-phosphate pyrophosphorylase